MSNEAPTSRHARWLLPIGTEPSAQALLIGRGLRAFADGYVAVLLPAYLLALGFGQLQVGFLSTATLAGSALATLAIGAIGHRWPSRRLLLGAACLMMATGAGFAGLSGFWPLAMIAFVGTLNASSGDVSVFLPLEHARLASAASGKARISLFARYSLTGSLCAAIGSLAAGLPTWLATLAGVTLVDALRCMFILYSFIGGLVWLLYRRLPARHSDTARPHTPLGPSRRTVWKLAGLFSIDSFAGGLVVNSLLALWLFERFGLSLTSAGIFFFWTGLLSAASQLAAPRVARRIGLLNTMVFTHIPANLCLIVAALSPRIEMTLIFLLIRSALASMDVPARSAYVMSVVTPAEREAAASFTAVPRSLAAAASPSLGGALLAAGMLSAPLVAGGVLKTAYDLTLLFMFRRHEIDEK